MWPSTTLSPFFLPSPPPPFLEFLAISSTTRPPNSFKIKMRVICMLEHELHTCTPKPPKPLSVLLLCVHLKNGRAEGKNLVKLCVFSLPDFQWCFALVFSMFDIGAPHQDGSTGRHQSHGRYRGIMTFFLSFYFFREWHKSKSVVSSTVLWFQFLIFFFLGRGGGNQIGDQRPEKVFTPPQHRHLFRRLY